MDSRRAEAIRLGVEAYIKVVGLQKAKHVGTVIRNITKQEFNGGKWSSGEGAVKIRFPTELFQVLRGVLPKLGVFPNFGDEEEDIKFMFDEWPDLVGKRRKKRNYAQFKL
jgi:hypothetical protein